MYIYIYEKHVNRRRDDAALAITPGKCTAKDPLTTTSHPAPSHNKTSAVIPCIERNCYKKRQHRHVCEPGDCHHAREHKQKGPCPPIIARKHKNADALSASKASIYTSP